MLQQLVQWTQFKVENAELRWPASCRQAVCMLICIRVKAVAELGGLGMLDRVAVSRKVEMKCRSDDSTSWIEYCILLLRYPSNLKLF